MASDMGGFPTPPFPTNGSGTYANRPAASTVAVGFVYYATDVKEGYRSDGSAWTVIPCGGTELGYAELTSSFSTTSTSYVDVTGLSITVTVGERPLMMRFNGVIQQPNTGVGGTVVGLVSNGSQVAEVFGYVPSANSYWWGHREQRISGLTPGTSYTLKMQLKSGGGTAAIVGGGNDISFVQVVTT